MMLALVLFVALASGRGASFFWEYGNWCGPLHGKETKDGGIVKEGLPVDELDESCRIHDFCYDERGYFSCSCDKELLERLAQVKCNTFRCVRYLPRIRGVFKFNQGICHIKERIQGSLRRRSVGQSMVTGGIAGVSAAMAGGALGVPQVAIDTWQKQQDFNRLLSKFPSGQRFLPQLQAFHGVD